MNILRIAVAALLLTATPIGAYAADPKVAVTLDGKGQIARTPFGPFNILATAEQTNGEIGIFVTTEAAGRQGPSHAHTGEAEVFYVLEGNYRFVVGDQTIEGGPGTTITIPRNVINHHQNIGTTEGRLLVMEIPGGFEQFFIEIDAQKADTPAKIWELEKKFGIVNSSLEELAKADAPK